MISSRSPGLLVVSSSAQIRWRCAGPGVDDGDRLVAVERLAQVRQRNGAGLLEAEVRDVGEDRRAGAEPVGAVELGRVDPLALRVLGHLRRQQLHAAAGVGAHVGDGERVVRPRQQAALARRAGRSRAQRSPVAAGAAAGTRASATMMAPVRATRVLRTGRVLRRGRGARIPCAPLTETDRSKGSCARTRPTAGKPIVTPLSGSTGGLGPRLERGADGVRDRRSSSRSSRRRTRAAARLRRAPSPSRATASAVVIAGRAEARDASRAARCPRRSGRIRGTARSPRRPRCRRRALDHLAVAAVRERARSSSVIVMSKYVK